MLLNSQKSRVIDGGSTTPYSIGNGTRQGEPVSADLFILALEVLFVFIKTNENIKGIEIFKYVLCTLFMQMIRFSF